MKKSRFTEEQIAYALKQVELGTSAARSAGDGRFMAMSELGRDIYICLN